MSTISLQVVAVDLITRDGETRYEPIEESRVGVVPFPDALAVLTQLVADPSTGTYITQLDDTTIVIVSAEPVNTPGLQPEGTGRRRYTFGLVSNVGTPRYFEMLHDLACAAGYYRWRLSWSEAVRLYLTGRYEAVSDT